MSPLTDEQRAEVEKSIGLAHYFAARYRVDESERDDFIQECCLSLMQAIQSDARACFSLGAIMGMRSKSAFFRLKRSRRPMTWIPRDGTRPTLIPLETPLGDEGFVLGDTIPDRGTLPDELAACREQLSRIEPHSDIERRVLIGRAQGQTFGDIAVDLGCSEPWARHILRQMTDSMSPP